MRVGAAFGAITQSLAQDILMPVVGLALQGTDFSQLGIVLGRGYGTVQEALDAGAPVIRYGQFLNSLLNFVVISLVLFLIVRGYNALRRRFDPKEEVSAGPPPAPSRQEVLLAEIRDLLRGENTPTA